MEPPDGNYIAWTLPGTTKLSFLPEAQALLCYREGDSRAAVQLRVNIREGAREFRMLLNRQRDRRFVGSSKVVHEHAAEPEEICLLTCIVLNADSTADHGLALGEVEWLSPTVGSGQWLGRFRHLKRVPVDPNSYQPPDSDEDDLEGDSLDTD